MLFNFPCEAAAHGRFKSPAGDLTFHAKSSRPEAIFRPGLTARLRGLKVRQAVIIFLNECSWSVGVSRRSKPRPLILILYSKSFALWCVIKVPQTATANSFYSTTERETVRASRVGFMECHESQNARQSDKRFSLKEMLRRWSPRMRTSIAHRDHIITLHFVLVYMII